ncbi:hypothetical protein PF005_g21170 [Phytophthora fragariae]|uniref:Uncharacterized protein n=1 Tax=Phytophthora fragariae TaxID=53985 RepID=A0A6A3E6Z9_9STRA|nr:hypothetical protein PF009_g22192 [Phytophthora fragariae]KAE9085315.1 hypothetical protein PF010_g20500 [Phytophthora fragariae]KAE9111539.1 hypothetical protein PF006_g20184 [Phytophthora fragariae]KAE9115821.1 hypothetical protein PF007_g9887 [Phytophthora fragariae]KAE9185649.1 hypothetical protein PF005_g21170 [Phytophthora fragariae]
MVELGASVDLTNNDDLTALMLASCIQRRDIVVLLLKAGAQVNYRGFFDRTALILASETGCSGVVEVLLESV